MGGFRNNGSGRPWSLMDTYGFIATFLTESSTKQPFPRPRGLQPSRRCSTQTSLIPGTRRLECKNRSLDRQENNKLSATHFPRQTLGAKLHPQRHFHNYFVTHLPSTSLHPDSRFSAGPGHKLPRAASTPHDPGKGPSPAEVTPVPGASRDLTVVRIPLQSAKHHFGTAVSRGTRAYNEDTFQAGTIEIPAFAKRAPISLSRSVAASKERSGLATSADSASGDPQVFYFGVFDGHGGTECSEFLKNELHNYIEEAAVDFELKSSLRKAPKELAKRDNPVPGQRKENSTEKELSSQVRESLSSVETEEKREIHIEISSQARESLSSIQMKGKQEVHIELAERKGHGVYEQPPASPTAESEEPVPQIVNKPKALELEYSLVNEWRHTVGGYFKRFKPAYFELPERRHESRNAIVIPPSEPKVPISIETVLMYAFLRCDLDFISAQASKPDPDSEPSDRPLNNDEILGKPSQYAYRIGGPERFKGGSTASIAMISTPSPTPFWHPASPSTLLVAHVGDTRILLCETSTGLAVPTTTNHHPSSPVESTRLRRYSATFVTDSFGEERMSGLANTRSFGDMRSKRIGVSAEPEIVRVPLGPAQYSFLVLVSDGVSGTLTDQEIVDVVKEAKTPAQGAQDVVSFATEVSRDGDNATCLVVRLGGWERRAEGGMGSLGTKEVRDFRKQDATDPRRSRTY